MCVIRPLGYVHVGPIKEKKMMKKREKSQKKRGIPNQNAAKEKNKMGIQNRYPRVKKPPKRYLLYSYYYNCLLITILVDV